MAKLKKVKADILLLKTDFKYNQIKIGFGEAFYYLKTDKKFHLSVTPFSDATLVKIDNLSVEKDTIEFDAVYKKENTHFRVDGSDYKAAPVVGDFIKQANEKTFTIDTSYSDNIEIQFEEEEIKIALSNLLTGEEILVDIPLYNLTYLPPESAGDKDPVSQWYTGATIQLNGNAVLFSASAENGEKFSYEWKLNFQPDFLPTVKRLLEIGVED